MTHAELEKERAGLLEHIDAVFRDVSRAGGVSWSQAEATDRCCSVDEVAREGREDTDHHWTELLEEHRDWEPAPGLGGFSFLDPIGFRYYLPAAMVLCVRGGCDRGILFHLAVGARRHRGGQIMLRKFEILTVPQRLCVRRFVAYMIEATLMSGDEYEAEGWLDAFTDYWQSVSNQ
ncbi:MAG: hypothetical protein IT438_13995 [Phycisphaerales bacterium]|nr:hypothetical protein [Phycisphaerales bacterium]